MDVDKVDDRSESVGETVEVHGLVRLAMAGTATSRATKLRRDMVREVNERNSEMNVERETTATG